MKKLSAMFLFMIVITQLSCSQPEPPAIPNNLNTKLNMMPTPDCDDDITLAPILIEPVTPVYPKKAQKLGITCTLWIGVLIDSTGVVTDAEPLDDSPDEFGFEEAAIDAALKTKWKPAKCGEKSIPVFVSFKVDFHLK